jgi:hypothetical protein
MYRLIKEVACMLGRRERTIRSYIYQKEFLPYISTLSDGYNTYISQAGYDKLQEILGTKDNKKRLP